MKRKHVGLLTKTLVAVAALVLSLPLAASANQSFWFDIENGVAGNADGWYYIVDTSDPGNAEGCLGGGTAVDDAGVKTYVIKKFIPPFSGNAERTRFLTVCYQGAYQNPMNPEAHATIGDNLTVALSIDYSGCVFWICKTTWPYTVLRHTPSKTYIAETSAGFPEILDIQVQVYWQ